MKNTRTIIIACILLCSGFGAVITQGTTNESFETLQASMSFSSPIITLESDGAVISLSQATSQLNTPGGYQLPVVTKVFTLPFRTKVTQVDVIFSDITTQTLSMSPRIAAEPISDEEISVLAAESVIQPDGMYPATQYTYTLATGRQDDSLVLFVIVHLYPVQYNNDNSQLISAAQTEIQINYLPPENPTVLADAYDLLILAPADFTPALQPLVDHKIAMGLATKLVAREEVCDGTYFPPQGRDCGEEMKYFIKSALDEWGIKYVLLVGGRKGGVMEEKWWMPVRYSNLDDSSNFEASYLTDLYFSDIYDSTGNFSSWDSNDNGVFAEWQGFTKDVLDMYPDVYVGRLACINKNEVKLMVNKIIAYETGAAGTSWVKKFIGVAGDTYPGPDDPYFEGELATNASFNYIQSMGYTANMVWASNGVFTGKQPVIDALSEGAGFVHFSGHGNPSVWSNHAPHNDTFITGLSSFDMGNLKNKEKQPIVLVGGCHNAQYNTSLLNILEGVLTDGLHYFSTGSPYGKYWLKEWVPRCWAWSMAARKNGGCIAIMANTGLGYGQQGVDCLTQRGRFLEVLFFRAFSEGKDILGETHGQELVYYMNEYPPMDDIVDCKIVQQWALLGDPSLMIGGYSS
jgi:hypothetical protein